MKIMQYFKKPASCGFFCDMLVLGYILTLKNRPMAEEMKNSKQEQFTFESFESMEDLEKKRKREVIFELALFLVLGILIGITVKTEAVKRITIGFSDYKIVNGKNAYNIEDIQKNLEQQAAAAQAMQQQQAQQ
jgi:hypothetical protein